MLLIGFHSVIGRLKRAPETITELYVDQARTDARMAEVLRRAEDANVRVHEVEARRLERLARQRRHQGVVAFAEAAFDPPSLEALLEGLERPALLLVLDGVTDPRNLGACLRVADGAGAQAVIAPKDHACQLTDVAVQTASGAAETVPYVMVTNLSRAFDKLHDAQVWTVGTADDVGQSVYELDLPESVAWVVGAEGRGLRRLTRDRCDMLASIPMLGAVSSLNVSVAAGLVLYESVRRRLAR